MVNFAAGSGLEDEATKKLAADEERIAHEHDMCSG
jgi:hypothetical protein